MSPLRIGLAVSVFVAVAFVSTLNAQSGPSPTFHSTDPGAATPQLSGDVICTVPQVYGPGGLVVTITEGHLHQRRTIPILSTQSTFAMPH